MSDVSIEHSSHADNGVAAATTTATTVDQQQCCESERETERSCGRGATESVLEFAESDWTGQSAGSGGIDLRFNVSAANDSKSRRDDATTFLLSIDAVHGAVHNPAPADASKPRPADR